STGRGPRSVWAGPSRRACSASSAALGCSGCTTSRPCARRSWWRGPQKSWKGVAMLEGIISYLQTRSALQLAKDALDVGIVYYIFYRALLVLRGTRAMQVGIGLGMVFLLYLVAQALQLTAVLSIIGALISSIILVIVVVFQNDIRRGLQRMGSHAWFSGMARARETEVIEKVVDAATELA